jgi:hypothetical protein
MHSASNGAGATSSTNAGGAVRREAPEAAAIRRFRWFHSTRNSVEVRLTPSFRATSTAVAHSSSGIAAFPLRFCLHSPKRALASSGLVVGVLLRGMAFPSPVARRQNDITN